MYVLFSLITVCAVTTAVSAQEGRKFLLAFPTSPGQATTGDCQIIISTNRQAKISITSADSTDHITVDDGSYMYSMDCEIRAPPGYSNKAVIVESDVDIFVQVLSQYNAAGDVYLALPYKDFGAEYILSTPPGSFGLYEIGSVFTIAADNDNTSVEVFATSDGGYTLVETITLSKFGTYTNASNPLADYTGWKLVSSAPVSVVTGSSYYQVTSGTCGRYNGGFIFAPSTEEAGDQFIIPQITKQSPGNSGAYIRVISFSQSNLIELPDQSLQQILNIGEYMDHYISPWNSTTRVQCREACIVILYNEVPCNTVSEGGFIIHITPLNYKSTFTQFAAIETIFTFYMANYLNVISDTTNILLDNALIHGFNKIPDWEYYQTSLAIDHGSHTLASGDGGKFVAFVYGHQIGHYRGYGSAVVHNARGTPEIPGQVPTYRISLISDWTSDDNMETSCVTQYSDDLKQKTLEMVVHLNSLIGESLCLGFTTDEMSITSYTSSFFSGTASGYAFISFVLSPASHIKMGDVMVCAEEVAAYSKPHNNWDEPLLEQIPGCANPVFEDRVFYDGDHQWICQNEMEYEEFSSIPSINIELVDIGKTHDSSDLPPECAFRYSLSLDDRALWMGSQLNSKLGNQLCPGMNGVSAATPRTTFTVQRDSALISIDFVLLYDTDISGGDALLCAEEVRQFVKIYHSWGLPLLPPESGCPDLEFDGSNFQDSSNSWICNV